MADDKKPKTLPPYKDIGKTLNDLITKGFPTTYKFELTTAADNGVKFVTSAERKQRDLSDESGNTVKSSYIFSSFQPKLELKDKSINASATIDSEKLSGEVSLLDLFTPGVKATFKGLTNSKQELSGELEYRSEAFSGTFGIFYKDEVPRAEFTALVGQSGVSVGALLSYFIPSGKEDGGPDGVSFLGNYTTGKFDIISSVNGKWAKDGTASSKALKINLGTKLLYTHDKNYTFGADVSYDISKNFKDGTAFTLLAQRKFDDNTTGKFKIDNKATFSVAVAQKVNSNTSLTVGLETNLVKDVEPKIGITLSFAP